MSLTSKPREVLHNQLWLWMLPLLLLSAALAADGLNADAIWYDELTSIGHAGGLTGPFSPLDIFNSLREHSPKHAPLFFQSLSGWGAIVGWHQLPLRSLSLFWGLIALAWVFRLGKDFIDPRAGFWASAFLGLNVFWLDYLHEIRMYALQFMLLTILLWHYFYLLRPGSSRRWYHWAGLTLSIALSLYAQPFSIFLLLALGFNHLLLVKKSRIWFQVAIAFLVAGLLYLPWLPVTLDGLGTKFDTAYDAMTLEQALGAFLRLFSNGGWLLLLLPLGAALLQLRQSRYRRRLLSFWLLAVLTLVILLLVNETVGLIPLRRSRYFLLSWSLWALLIGGGLAYFKPRLIAPLFIIIYLASGFALREAEDYLSYQGTVSVVHIYPPLGEYVSRLRGLTSEQDYLVGFSGTDFVNRRGKHGKSTADYYLETLLGIDGVFIPAHYNAEQLEGDLPRKLANNPYLLFTYDPTQPPANLDLARQFIQQGYQPCAVILDSTNLVVQRYVYQPLSCERDYQPIHYDNGIRIVDKFAQYNPAGETARVTTGWEVANDDLLYEYNVSIQVLRSDGEKVLQTPDRHLYADVLKWYVAEFSIADLPPGDYHIVVIVYDRYSYVKISAVDLASGERAKILPISSFTIEK